jgi:hypothetical protein
MNAELVHLICHLRGLSKVLQYKYTSSKHHMNETDAYAEKIMAWSLHQRNYGKQDQKGSDTRGSERAAADVPFPAVSLACAAGSGQLDTARGSTNPVGQMRSILRPLMA